MNALRRWVHPLFVSTYLLLAGIIGFIVENNSSIQSHIQTLCVFIGLAGISLGSIWFRLIVNYQTSYSTKLKTIRAMEKRFRLRLIGSNERLQDLSN